MTESYNICRKHRLEDCEICAAPYGTCDWCGRVLGRKHYVKSNQFFDAKWCSPECAATDLGVEEVE
jgi:hypothetical protein